MIVRGIRRSSSHVLSFGEQFIDPTPPPVVIIFPSITRVVILVLPLRLFLTLDEEDSICFAKLSLSKKHNNNYSKVISWSHLICQMQLETISYTLKNSRLFSLECDGFPLTFQQFLHIALVRLIFEFPPEMKKKRFIVRSWLMIQKNKKVFHFLLF